MTDENRLSPQDLTKGGEASTPVESQTAQFQGDAYHPLDFTASNTSRNDFCLDYGGTLSHTNPYEVDDDRVTETPFTIPVGHLTTTGSLLSLPQVRGLIGYYPQDIFLQLESQRTIELPFPVRDPTSFDYGKPNIRSYIENFFAKVHPSYPIMDKNMFSTIHTNAIEHGPKHDFNTALLLVVIGFGKMVSNLHDYPDIAKENDHNGIEYFAGANQIIAASWLKTPSLDVALSMSLVYGAMYMSYLDRPIQMWKLIHQASTSLQFIISQ